MKKRKLSVISTYATDRLINAEKMQVVDERKGGPVYYIVDALKKMGISPEIYTAEDMVVEIIIKKDDEFGKINRATKVTTLPKIATDSAIVSTLLNEWSLSNANTYNGALFVDIQGFVRDGSEFGKKKRWKDIKNIAPYIFCLKGNNTEISMLPTKIIKDQKENRMLIVTKDKNGVEIFYRGQYIKLKPKEILHPINTIGAGDTWFANFVAKFIQTKDVEISAMFAIDQTSKFLKSK